MKNLVKIVSVSLFIFLAVKGHSSISVESVLNNQNQQQQITKTCPIYPICREQLPANEDEPMSTKHGQIPMIANTCPIYPICKGQIESEVA